MQEVRGMDLETIERKVIFMRATCTWGDGPDVLVELAGTTLLLHETVAGKASEGGQLAHGCVKQGSLDLTADEAEVLAIQLLESARQARNMKESAERWAGADLELLTCWKCPERYTCPWADDLYNTDGDCLAMK